MATGEKNSYTNDNQTGLLFIEPKKEPTQKPIIDALTRRMTAAYNASQESDDRYRGFHVCKCGVASDNTNHYIENLVTNSLCIHYLAYHREEIPPHELLKVHNLKYGETEPTEKQLATYATGKNGGRQRY